MRDGKVRSLTLHWFALLGLRKAPWTCGSSASSAGAGVDAEMRQPSTGGKPWGWMTWPRRERREEGTALGRTDASVMGGWGRIQRRRDQERKGIGRFPIFSPFLSPHVHV